MAVCEHKDRLLGSVRATVSCELVAAAERLETHCAFEGPLPRVGPEVPSELVAAAEGLTAQGALEGLVARVDAEVRAQLVGPTEPLGAQGAAVLVPEGGPESQAGGRSRGIYSS